MTEQEFIQSVKKLLYVYEETKKGNPQVVVATPKTAYRAQAPRKEPSYSNGIPRCPVHDRNMHLREGQYGNFYSCSAKEDDPDLSNAKGFCKFTVRV